MNNDYAASKLVIAEETGEATYRVPELFQIGTAKELIQGNQLNASYRDCGSDWRSNWPTGC